MSQNDSDKEIKVNYVSEIIVLPHIKIVENSQEFDPTSREKVMTHANEAVILSSFPLEIKENRYYIHLEHDYHQQGAGAITLLFQIVRDRTITHV